MDDELYHIGIKGRSGRYPLGSGERPYQDYPGMRQSSNRSIKKSRKADIKNIRALTDSDLNKKIDRLKKEKELKELTTSDLNSGKLAAGKQQVKKILSTSLKSTLTVVGTNFLPYATTRLLQGKEISAADFGQYLAQKLGLKDFVPTGDKKKEDKKDDKTDDNKDKKDTSTKDNKTDDKKKEDKKDDKTDDKKDKKETSNKDDTSAPSKNYKELFDHLNGKFDINADDLYKPLVNDFKDAEISKKEYDKINKWADTTIDELEEWLKRHNQNK